MKLAVLVLALGACGAAPPPAAPAPSPPPAHAHAHATEPSHAPEHKDHDGGGMHHGFKNAEDWAKVFDDPARDAWQEPDRVVAALALTPTMTVADIGAGTGYFAVRIARAVPRGEVIATDLEPDMIRFMTERAQREGLTNLRAIVTPADDPGIPPGSVDRILIVDVWHHLGDRAAYARKLVYALRQGGQLVIVDFKLDAKRGPPAKFRLAPADVIAELASVGLTAKVTLELADQYVITARRAP